MECASNFDGNLHDVLRVRVMPGDLDYNPAEMPASIGLYGACYTITFYPGECVWFSLCQSNVVSTTNYFFCRCGLPREGSV